MGFIYIGEHDKMITKKSMDLARLKVHTYMEQAKRRGKINTKGGVLMKALIKFNLVRNYLWYPLP